MRLSRWSISILFNGLVSWPVPESFAQRLKQALTSSGSLLCVGLDPDTSKFPSDLGDETTRLHSFDRRIIDATYDIAAAYKPQIAFYSALGAENQLAATIRYIRERAPRALIILDAKRGDIGNTAEAYAREAFDRYGADAVTVNPYLGTDSLEPFLAYEERGVIVLCRTSNPGAGDLQDLDTGGRKLFEVVAQLAATRWNTRGNCALVVGATYPQDLARVRALTGDMPFLVPGVGAQGGDVQAVVSNGQTAAGDGLMVSSSRAILYAASDDTWVEAARTATRTLRDQINQHRARR
jgi:orotidine-5'-phosphate decarboxylase